MKIAKTRPPTAESSVEMQNRQVVDSCGSAISSLRIVISPEPVVSPSFLPQDWPSLVLGDQRVLGYGFVQDCQVTGAAVSQGLLFGKISVTNTAKAIFIGCSFSASPTVESGGHAQFVGCYFTNCGVQNAGSNTDVFVTGGVRTGSVPHVNCTVASELVI